VKAVKQKCVSKQEVKHTKPTLTHYRPAMPFGNRKKYFGRFFLFGIVKIKKISPLET